MSETKTASACSKDECSSHSSEKLAQPKRRPRKMKKGSKILKVRQKRKRKFSREWMGEDEFHGWLKPYGNNSQRAKCIICGVILTADRSKTRRLRFQTRT